MVNSSVPKPKTKRDGLYIHPKGSITKPTKVSCASCISGHRSGACDHYDRILLQIRAAGRPSTTCHHQSSCGGACLQQKAFIIPSEFPQWCGDHRSCVENWEYSDRCPPYPVSSAKSTKRKERSNSPQVPYSASSTAPAGPNERKSSVLASSCASETSQNGKMSSIPPATPTFAAAPGMVKASTSTSTTPWLSTETDYSFLANGHYDRPSKPVLQHLPHTLSIPQTSFPETSNLNSVSASLDIPFSQSDHRPWKPPYDPFLTTFSFEPPEQSLPLTSPLSANPFLSPSLVTRNPTSSIPTAAAPLRQRSSPRQTQPQQTHPCPGNGFQCPCDENCMCQDCYTHGRGFWTLPFSFADLPPEEHYSSPSHITMPPSTFPEALRGHASPYDELGGTRRMSASGFLDDEDGQLQEQGLTESTGGCCSDLNCDDWLA